MASLPFYQDPQFFRLQTYGMVVIAALLIATLFTPLVLITVPPTILLTVFSNRIEVTGGDLTNATNAALEGQLWLLQAIQVLTAFGVGTTLAALFRYRNLERLASMTGILIAVLVALLGLRIYGVYAWLGTLEAQHLVPKSTFGIGYFLPLVALLLLSGVRRQIRADQAKLKSAERFY